VYPYCYPCDPTPKAVTPRIEAIPWKNGENKGLYNHVGNHLECIKSRKLPNCDIAIGAEVANLAHLANISSRVGVGLQWDNKTNTFIGNKQANDLAKANYRAPWKLPKV
jgi:hypothetical protein